LSNIVKKQLKGPDLEDIRRLVEMILTADPKKRPSLNAVLTSGRLSGTVYPDFVPIPAEYIRRDAEV
jgi:hypothetical protein